MDNRIVEILMNASSVEVELTQLPCDSSSVSTNVLRQAQAADPVAWRRLVQLCGPIVYSWCRRSGLQADDAADVGQEIFLAVATGIQRFRRDRSGDSFRGWLWGITHNKVKEYWRKRGREPVAPGGTSNLVQLAMIATEQSSSLGKAGDKRNSGGFQRLFNLVRDTFEPRTWQAFWRTTVEGASPAEIAVELNMSIGAVYIARSRVLRRLREEFDELV